MRRRSLLSLAVLSPLAFLQGRFGVRAPGNSSRRNLLQETLDLDRLATEIHTPDDARRFIDRIADIFSDIVPSVFLRSGLLTSIANAEFAAVTNPASLIPEQRIAHAWNDYVLTLQAPAETHVTAAEFHNLRDSLYINARYLWAYGSRNFWAMPSIYATLPGGSLAPGCRAIEAIRLLWDLGNMPSNVQGARDRTRQGVLVSDTFKQPPPTRSIRASTHGTVINGAAMSNPVEVSARRYASTHGNGAFLSAVTTLLDRTLA